MFRRIGPAGLVLVLLALGCHREIEMVPLSERTIYATDRFYDVQALGNDRAFVVGYGGKILETSDGGQNWAIRPSGVDVGLYDVCFADEQHGWVSGQDGLILRTADGGKTWQRQESNAVAEDRDGSKLPVNLFALDCFDRDHAWAVGDRSILTATTDGKTWRSQKIAAATEDISGGESLAAADPIFYDLRFLDLERGWVVGEFGKILHTQDGGATWREQQHTLMEGTDFYDPLDLPTLYGLHMSDAERGVASGIEAHLARTTDGGQVWRFDRFEVDYPLLDPLFRVAELPDGQGWAVGAAGEIVHRAAGAAAWKRAEMGQDVLTWLRGISFSRVDQRYGWMVGGYGLIYRTTDGGQTWLPSQG